jgi:hypothetical protein
MLLGSEGKYSQFGFGLEQVAGEKAATMYYAKAKPGSFKFTPNRPLVFPKGGNVRGQQNRGQNVNVDLPFSIGLDADVDSIARLMGHLRGYASLANLGGAAWAWTERDWIKNVDTMASVYDTLSVEGDRDDGTATLLLGVVLNKSKMKVADKALVDLSFEGMAQNYTEHNDSANLVDAGTFTGRVLIRGNRLKDASTDANVLKFKVTTPGAPGTALIKWTKGAVAYGANTRATTLNTWLPLLLADDTNASGDPLEPMEYRVTGTVPGTFSLNDERQYAMARTKGVASFSARNPLSIAGMTVTIGGVTYYIGGVDIEHTRPRAARRAGTKYPVDFLNDGTENWKITLTRKYTDRVAWDLLKSGAVAALDIQIQGDIIGATAFREQWRRQFPQVQIVDAGADPDKDGSLDETIQIEPSYDGTNAVCTETFNCTLATLI